MSDRPCPEHERRVVACIRAGHLDEAAAAQLRKDVAMACTPGRYCPPRETLDELAQRE